MPCPLKRGAGNQREQQSPEAKVEPPDLVDAGPDEEALGEEDFACHECVAPRILPDPGQPTQKLLDDHRVDHLPFRSWCPECVVGRATGEQHVVRKDPEQIATFSMDYLYRTKSRVARTEDLEEGEDVEMKVLVAKDSKSKTVLAHSVVAKGSDEDAYVVSRLVEDIAWLGHTEITLKSDNEPTALDVLKGSLKTARVEVEELEQIQEEQAVTYDSRSNGDAEDAVKQVTKLPRTFGL